MTPAHVNTVQTPDPTKRFSVSPWLETAANCPAQPERIHLDAAPSGWLPVVFGRSVERRSAGKGSPSAQTAPPSKYSFFQMGTVRLRVSMSQRHASNAAARWDEATTISTLVSL